MPYILHERREVLDRYLYGLPEEIGSAGDLAYVIHRLMLGYWHRAPSYARWAELRGIVDDQVDEFRRRVVEEYENRKIGEHGDVTK
jgi:hypothetical protein